MAELTKLPSGDAILAPPSDSRRKIRLMESVERRPLEHDLCQSLAIGRSGELYGWFREEVQGLPRAVVVVCHGLGEHSGRFAQFAAAMSEFGYLTVAYDQQGHGKSPGKRGTIHSYDAVVNDLDSVCEFARERWSKLPVFVLGNSMGANVAVNYALRWPHGIRGLILVAPMLLPANPPKRDQVFAAWLTGKLLPMLRMRAKIHPSELTHDPVEVQALETDPLMHRKMSLRLGSELIAQGRWALDHVHELQLPILLLHGEEDSLVDAAQAEAIKAKTEPHTTLVNLPGMYHDILHEKDRQTAFNIIADWLKDRTFKDEAFNMDETFKE